MTRFPLLMGIVLMLAAATASPGQAWIVGYLGVGEYGGATAATTAPQSSYAITVGGLSFCYNCSDLTVIPVDASLSAQPASQLLPGSLQFMIAQAWGPDEEREDSWVWRGKVRSRWESAGFDSGTFELFMTMKGAGTRSNLLSLLPSTPKDRMQLAHELGLDWRAVDYQIDRLYKCGLVQEERAFGKVTLYRLTALGMLLLELLREYKKSWQGVDDDGGDDWEHPAPLTLEHTESRRTMLAN
jgi:DNA-binding transcriptional ArsR family regulator